MGKVVVIALLLLASCGALKSLEDGVESLREVRKEYLAAKAAADTNKDGRTSPQEWMIYIASGLGAVAAAAAAAARRRAHQIEAELDQLYDDTHEPIRDSRPTVISS